MRYNLSKGKASLNSIGLGGGISLRYYPDEWMATTETETIAGKTVLKENGKKDLKKIKPECRASTWSAKTLAEDSKNGKLAFSAISFSSVVFAAKEETTEQLTIQPALIVGIFRDLVQIGFGYSASGPGRGETFLMMGFGTGFNF